jgi:hypothetical protein
MTTADLEGCRQRQVVTNEVEDAEKYEQVLPPDGRRVLVERREVLIKGSL